MLTGNKLFFFQLIFISDVDGPNLSRLCFRLHHCAGSKPLELHGTVYSVICLDCGFSFCRNLFQDEVKALNPKVGDMQVTLHFLSLTFQLFHLYNRSL